MKDTVYIYTPRLKFQVRLSHITELGELLIHKEDVKQTIELELMQASEGIIASGEGGRSIVEHIFMSLYNQGLIKPNKIGRKIIELN